MKTIALIGVGNILFKDDGFGVYAAKYLETNYCFNPPIDIIDGGTLGINLVQYFLSYERVILLDTLSMDDAPGTIYNLPSDVLIGLGNTRKTVHEVEVTQMLELGEMSGQMGKVSIVGIIPEDIISIEIGLSRCVQEALLPFVKAVLVDLQQYGVQVSAQETPRKIEMIIEDYRNPSHRDL